MNNKKKVLELKELTSNSLRKIVPTDFSKDGITLQDLEDTLRHEIKELLCYENGSIDHRKYRDNKYILFDLIQEIVDDILPISVIDVMGRFAEVRQYAQGDRPVFKKLNGRIRGKQFVTQVGLAGRMETFRLDASTFEIPMQAYGGACTIDFERYLDGLESIMELYAIMLDALTEKIYLAVQNVLYESWNAVGRPARNKLIMTGFDADEMQDMVNTIQAYGSPVIITSPQFAATMTNSIDYAQFTPNIPIQDLIDIRNQGYIGTFRGTPIVVLPQSFEDETNTKFTINPRLAFVLPAGKERLIKINMEGNTLVQDKEGDRGDWSREINWYKKIGVAMIAPLNFWGIVQNTDISADGWDILP